MPAREDQSPHDIPSSLSSSCRDTEECRLLDVHAALGHAATDLARRRARVFSPETVDAVVTDVL
ncbi:hypothetical protein Acsp04_60020 [Actinomadura sp. NBRC 104425]|uniref:hypothetical protein n=1 Tax=Actinomadura sp. NBRC 104425 TaxID=3032204 RepID=UPI0024A0158D|nr:hypothetical protein [Actinomadura sp. NBRC 104425]GLZ15767.1 hypothetical protein Acsp04_60020 [Actinomadura sp. NBRC 104425]